MSFNIDEFWERGYCVLSENVSSSLILNVYTFMQSFMEIDRGHDSQGKYHARLPDYPVEWANYWSQDLNNVYGVNEIAKFYLPQISLLLDNPVLYHSDFVVTTPHHRGVRPHIDTPYRFESFEHDERLLAVQCLMPLTVFDSSTGSTAFVPGSHRQKWNIKECYQGVHDEYFRENCQQVDLRAGEMLIWHPRILHSAMPNNSVGKRCALLMLFVEQDVNDEIRVIDNIFT